MTNDPSSAAGQSGLTDPRQSGVGSGRATSPRDLEFHSVLARELHELMNLLWPAAIQAECASSESAAVLADLVKRIGRDVQGALTIATRMRDLVQRHLEYEPAPGPEPRTLFVRRAPPAPAIPLRVLCVDDDPDVRGALTCLLAFLGHHVDSVTSGTEALRAFAEGEYDVVLINVRWQKLDARDITRRIHALRPTPVIWLDGEGCGATETIVAAEPDGPNCILAKPLSLDALRNALDKATAGGTTSASPIRGA